jgi:hypothetical protein
MRLYKVKTIPFATSVGTVLLALSACTTSALDPQAVGNGQYLQIVKDAQVLAEMETSSVGMMNCPNQAYLAIQQTPSLAGLVKCAHVPTTQQLPFSFSIHYRLDESDGYRRSSPNRTKTLTSQLCLAMLNASKTQEKAVVVENQCGA